MATKQERLILIDNTRRSLKQAYKIKKAVNTVDYQIGNYLSVQEVHDINLRPDITIEIVEK